MWLEGWENSQGSQIPSVLQMRRQIASAGGQAHDFIAEVKGEESARLSEHKRRDSEFGRPLRAGQKSKNKERAGAAGTPLKPQIGGRGGGTWMGG